METSLNALLQALDLDSQIFQAISTPLLSAIIEECYTLS